MNLKNALWSAILLAGAAVNGCTNPQQPDPAEYKLAGGLNIATFESVADRKIFRYETMETLSQMVFYSDEFPILSLAGFKLSIVFLSEETFTLLIHVIESELWEQTTTVSLKDNQFFQTGDFSYTFPNCDENGYLFGINHYVPKDGVYDFYFRIENREAGIYYKTNSYRYSVTTDNNGYYITTNLSLIP